MPRKAGPIHELVRNQNVIATTWCGVDPYRQTVQVVNQEGAPVRIFDRTARKCEACVKAKLKAEKKK